MDQRLPVCMSTAHHQVIPPAPKRVLEAQAVIFFDGTLNNRRNTHERELAEMGTYSESYRKYGAGDSSYSNDYTNVALLNRFAEYGYNAAGSLRIKIYIEGIGTTDLEADDTIGYALGTGDSGIVSKVQRAITRLEAEIAAACGNEAGWTVFLRIDVIGFSRGAAAARHFIHAVRTTQMPDAANPKKSLSLSERLRLRQLALTKLSFGFTGLFDTVASIGLVRTSAELSATAMLHLDSIQHAEAVFQIAAADEHRSNFALTDINSAGNKGFQLFLPGVHCDIGGSYVDYASESFSLLYVGSAPVTNYTLNFVKHELEMWISDGWFTWRDVSHNSVEGGLKGGDSLRHAIQNDHKVKVRRAGSEGRGLRNKYSLVALHLMRAEAERHGIKFSQTIQTQARTSLTSGCPALIRDVFTIAHKDLTNRKPLASFSPEMLRMLRRDYFHFSANYDKSFSAFAPRYIGSVRTRKIHNG